MKKAFNPKKLADNIAQQILDFDTIYYCTAIKESQTGLMQNNRLLVLQQSDFSFFYTKQIPTQTFYKSGKIPTGKTKVKITQLKYQRNVKKLQLEITVKRLDIKWKFVFQSAQMLQKWQALIEILKEKASFFYQNRKSMKSIASRSTLTKTESCKSLTLQRNTSMTFSNTMVQLPWDSEKKKPLQKIKSSNRISLKKIQQFLDQEGIENQLYQQSQK